MQFIYRSQGRCRVVAAGFEALQLRFAISAHFYTPALKWSRWLIESRMCWLQLHCVALLDRQTSIALSDLEMDWRAAHTAQIPWPFILLHSAAAPTG